ncbi:(4Fe-4S)-binding protein [Streptomyces sp. WAC 04229]|uniref:(4Fe-4S)-binding protein n=1 Tax=Streptomyces sp. WAC 04229 TaxID=2203206 RepID=UPI003D720FEE
MSGESARKTYRTESITVTFEAGRCLHAAECVGGLPEVFDPVRRPWIQPERATAERLAEVVRRCPSGALQYELAEGAGPRGQ